MRTTLSSKEKMMNLLDEMPSCLENIRDQFVFCTICKVGIKGLRKRNLNGHLCGKKHRTIQEKLECNIPLYKLRNEAIQSLLVDFTGYRVPETTARSYTVEFSKKVKEKTKEIIKDKRFYMIVDETNIKRLKIWNFLIGFVDKLGKEILLTTTENSSHSVEYSFFNEVMLEFNLFINNMVLFISDAAGYNNKFYNELIKMNQKIKHVTCFAHLIHNCISFVFRKNPEIKSFLHDMNRLIGKNDQMYYEIKAIKGFSKPLATRWGSFMKFLIFIVDHIGKMKQIINKHTNNKSTSYANIKRLLENTTFINQMK